MTAIELLEALSEASVRASFQKTLSILLALSEIPLITLEVAIAQLEAQNNTIRYLHALLVFSAKKVMTQDIANIPKTYLYELPTLNLIQFFCHLLTELQTEQEVGLWHELGAGPGLISGVLQQHYQKRGWTFPCTSSDQFPSENITRQETVAEFTRNHLRHFKSNKTHIIFISWPAPSMQGEILELLNTINKKNINVHVFMLTQSWCKGG